MVDLKKKKAIENYWLRKLAGDMPKILLPFSNRDPAPKEAKKTKMRMKVVESITARLREISDSVDMALFILFFSGLNIILHKYTGLEDLVIGTVSPREENVKDKIILCRNRVSGEMIFKEIINRVNQSVLEDFNHADYSFGIIYQKLMTVDEINHLDVFNVACIYDKIQNKSHFLNQFDLILVLSEVGNHLDLEVEYNSNLYEGEMIQRFCQNLLHIFDNISGKIDREIAKISIVCPREQRELMDFNRTQSQYPHNKTIHELFEQQAEKRGDNIAVIGSSHRVGMRFIASGIGTTSITYGELNEKSNQLARLLREKGVTAGTIIGIMIERSVEMVVGMLGILKAGAAYLPIDCDFPTGRITSMLDDSRIPFLLTQNSIAGKHAFTALQGLDLGKLNPWSSPCITPPSPRILDFDELPFVDRSLIDYEKYNRYIGQAIVKNRVLIQASRGCPHNCAYCYRIWPRKQVARSGENIFKEITLYYNLGMRKFDIFMLNIKEGKQLFELIVENKLEDIELYFPNGFRGDLLTREYIDLMVKAGTVNFALALETASPRLQKLINKNLNLEKFREIVEYVCQKYPNVILELFTMHGIPTETQEEALMTLNFIKSLKWVHFPYVNVLKIYQHTHMEKLALENGVSREAILRSESLAWHEWSDTLPFDKNVTSGYQAEFLSEYLLSKERLLHVLPYQMKILTEDEFVQKYDSYFPGDIRSFADFLKFAGLREDELGGLSFRDAQEDEAVLCGLNEKIARAFPAKELSENAFRVLLLDLSQFFSDKGDMLYDVVDPPLGLMYILTYLQAQLGDKINGRILKSRLDFDSYEELKAILEEFKPQVIGVRTLTYYKDFFHQTAAAIRQWGFDGPIITGGPYTTVDYETILQDRNIDVAVLGEGEITFCELIKKIMDNSGKLPYDEMLKKIAGIAFVPKTDPTKTTNDFAREIIMMDELRERTAGESTGDLENINRSSDPAYIIFTSGSTGKPKGVIVEHKSAVNVLNWFGRTYNIQKDTHVLQLTNYTFDPSVEQIFGSLLHGSTVYIGHRELAADNHRFAEFVERNQIHIFNFVPGILENLLQGENKFSSLQAVISGGEKLEESVKNRILGKGYRLYNHYGPTETTVDALMSRCTADKVTLGCPIFNVRCYIMDKHLNLVPISVPGELYIGGAGVARGYLNRPGLTAEKFDQDFQDYQDYQDKNKNKTDQDLQDFQDYQDDQDEKGLKKRIGKYSFTSLPLYPSTSLYRTGDLVRWFPNGSIEFFGRIDHQVKIRGYRIELGEIESLLQKHVEIKEAVVVARKNIQGDSDKDNEEKEDICLCAYIIPHPNRSSRLTDSQLRAFLSMELAEYMIPSYFVILEAFPLLPSGKVDRESLPVPREPGLEDNVEYAGPKNEIEKKLVDTWENVLSRDSIGINENFFLIGGDSIKSIQIVSRMNEAGYKVEMSNIFKYPTISKLAFTVRKFQEHADQSITSGTVPLTPAQKEFFQTHKVEPHHFNQSIMFYSEEGFDEEATRAVFLMIQEHHDALRMTFREENGERIQINHGLEFPFSLHVYDFREQKNAAEILKIRVNEIQASIDLAKGPLMKLGLFHMDDGDRLLIAIHHLVVDGVSWRILFGDIESLFRQYKKGEPFVLPLKTDSFKLWSEKLSEFANSESFLRERNYWADLESTEIPGIKKDFQDEQNYLTDSHTLSFSLNKKETDQLLTTVNRAFGTEINDILLTALGLGIKETYGVHRVLIALEGHGREEIFGDVNTNRTVGFFTSIYPVVLDVSFDDDLSRQIKEIKENLHRLPNKGIGYGILKYLTADENKNKSDIDFKLNPQISFNYLGQFDADIEQRMFTVVNEGTGDSQSMKAQREYELDITGILTNGQLIMSIVYNEKQYHSESIKKLLKNYKAKLCQVISFCTSQKKKTPTPSDFTYKRLSIDAVDAIAAFTEGQIEDIYTLSPMQESMLFHALFAPSSSAYFEQMSYRLHGELDGAVVEKSLNELFKRYDILRTFFIHKGLERPVQVVLKHRQVDFYYKDLGERISLEKKETFITGFKEKERRRSFDLSKDVLMRVAVIKVSDKEYEFIWSHHHILMDGWCTGILISEFFEIYNSYLEKKAYRLPAVIPYRIYIQWLDKQNEEESKNYWENYLQGYEGTANIPTVGSIESIKSGSSGDKNEYKKEQVLLELDKEKTSGLRYLVGKNQVTLNTILQTVWGIILGRYNSQRDVVFGVVVSGRPSEIPGVESMIGLFINTIPARIKYEARTKFNELLKRVQEETLEGEHFFYYPLAKIQSGTQQKQNLLDHILAFQNFPVTVTEQIERAVDKADKSKENNQPPLLKVSNFDAFEQINYNFDALIIPGDQLIIEFTYNANVYEKNLVERIANQFILIFNQILNNDDLMIDDLTLISEEERAQILYDFNDTGSDFPNERTIHELFEEQVERTGDNIAVIGMGHGAWGMASLTYNELNEKSNQLAHRLREKGVEPDTIVGIMAERSMEMIISILGILKAGGAYLPIDPEYPEERIKYMLADSAAKILLTSGDNIPVGTGGLAPLYLPLEDKSTSHHRNPQPTTSPEHLAYVIYTSGSTGNPKGVMVEHRNVTAYLFAFCQEFELTQNDTVLQQASFTFDTFIEEVFPFLVKGGKIAISSRDDLLDINRLSEFITNQCISIISCSPLLLNELNKIDDLKSVHTIISGGDVVKGEYVDNFREVGKVYNTYGPTETTVCVTYYRFPGHLGSNINIPIGKPISNYNAYILDKNHGLLPMGIPGELCVSGKGVTRGYLNNPVLTPEKFVPNPFEKGERMYKTGDLVRWLPTGDIQFLGRIDQQVKIRGYRIELGEIENQLSKHHGIKEAVVVVEKNETENGENYLCAYVVPPQDPGTLLNGLNTSELREYLLTKLPGYMVPTHFVQIEKIPVTANGKVDSKALKGYGTALGTGVEYAPPKNKMEERIARTWKEILKLDKVGRHDNFFDLGGNSLNIIRINNKLNEILEMKNELSIVAMFDYPTVESLSEYLIQRETGGSFMEKEIAAFDAQGDEAVDMMEQTLEIIRQDENE